MESEVSDTELSLLDYDKLYEMKRGDEKSSLLRAILSCAISGCGRLDTLRTWFTTSTLFSSKRGIVGIRYKDSNPHQILFNQLQLPAPAQCALKLIDGVHWPPLLGSVEAGMCIVDDDSKEVLCWMLDTCTESLEYTFVEYIHSNRTLHELLAISSSLDAVTITKKCIDYIFKTMADAWKRGVVHTRPYLTNILVQNSIEDATWVNLHSLRTIQQDEVPTKFILAAISGLYTSVRAALVDNDTRQSCNAVIDNLCVSFSIPLELRLELKSINAHNYDADTLNLKIWARNLYYDEWYVEKSSHVNLATPFVVPVRKEPFVLDGYVYNALIVADRKDINVTSWQSYEDALKILFDNTKTEVETLFAHAANNIKQLDSLLYSDQNYDSVDRHWDLTFSIMANWCTIRILVDLLATKRDYRQILCDDILTINIENYVNEIRSRVMRVSGEWEDSFKLLYGIFSYERTQRIVLIWNAIRNTFNKIY